MTTPSRRGGSRPGAGRKPAKDPLSRTLYVRVTEADAATFMRLGGSEWLRSVLRRETAREAYKKSDIL